LSRGLSLRTKGPDIDSSVLRSLAYDRTWAEICDAALQERRRVNFSPGVTTGTTTTVPQVYDGACVRVLLVNHGAAFLFGGGSTSRKNRAPPHRCSGLVAAE